MSESSAAQSIKARILNMSAGDNKKYQQLIVRFFHERLLYRLSRSEFRDRFILKGGALLYAFDEFAPRPTLDIDFMGKSINNEKENILEVFRKITSVASQDDGLQFLSETLTAQDITTEKEYPGVRVSLIGTLGSYRQKLTLDIGFGDVIVPHPIKLQYPALFHSMAQPDIMAYSLETVVAEKFQTMIDRGRFNSRMKDYFDLYRILSVHEFESGQLEEAIVATFENRGTRFVENHDFFSSDFGEDLLLNRQWENYKKKMKLEIPSFREIHRLISRELIPYWNSLGDKQIDGL